jgi:hypothetical protein
MLDFAPGELARSKEPRVLARQHQLFDSILSFTLAHELAHHALPHAACSPEARRAQQSLNDGCVQPHFSLPLEIEADEFAMRLLTGAKSAKLGFHSAGTLALFQLFARWEDPDRSGIRTALQRKSLPSALRVRLIRELGRNAPRAKLP